jgi:actin-related protein
VCALCVGMFVSYCSLAELGCLGGQKGIRVSVGPKGLDSRELGWRGGAALCTLDAADALWIPREEWLSRGAAALRSKAPFVW